MTIASLQEKFWAWLAILEGWLATPQFYVQVAAIIAERAFELLDAPLMRLAGLDTPIPFSPPLEDAFRPNAAKIAAAVRDLAAY